MLFYRYLSAAVGLCTLLPTLSAQGNTLHYRLDGAAAGDHFGHAIAPIADLNGDGRTDLIVGAPYASPSGMSEAGSAFVYSGADGTLLFTVHGQGAGAHLGHTVTGLEDVDGDAIPDFGIGAPFASTAGLAGNGAVYIHSGADGSLIVQLDGTSDGGEFGAAILDAGQLDWDGTGDILIGEPEAMDPSGGGNRNGRVLGVALPSGTYRFNQRGGASGSGVSYRYGSFLSHAGDANGDGKREFLSGLLRFSTNYAYLHRMNDGTQLFPFRHSGSDTFGERAMANLGDLNQDGFDEFGFGDHEDDSSFPLAGNVEIVSGKDFHFLHRWNGAAQDARFGSGLASAGDLDGDGIPEVLVGIGDPDLGTGTHLVEARAGVDGGFLFSITGDGNFGFVMTSLDDLDGDGLADFAIASPLASPGGLASAGSVSIYR